MIIVAILAHNCIRKLDIMKHSVSKVDDILLYICMPCIFLYAAFSMVPAIQTQKLLFVVVCLVKIIQAVLQTALICDGLRRCSNSVTLNSKKPGRELVTFLIVANVALWLLETFEIKSYEGNYYKYNYYGAVSSDIFLHLFTILFTYYCKRNTLKQLQKKLLKMYFLCAVNFPLAVHQTFPTFVEKISTYKYKSR